MTTVARGSDRQRIVIVGAGLSGLTAGLYLRGAGHDVTILERAAAPGGLVRTEALTDADGTIHQFDTGATILTMPTLAVDALGAVGVGADDARTRLALTPIDPSYAMRFADGTGLDVRRDRHALVKEVDHQFGADAARGVSDLLTWLDCLYDVEFDSFIDHNFDGVTEFARAPLRRSIAGLIRLGATRGLTGAVARFVSDERLQRVFTFQSLYAGVAPQRAAAVYAIIAQMDIGQGVSYPSGGMGRVGRVLADAFTDAGGVVEFNTTATSLIRDTRRRITSVRTDTASAERIFDADTVIATIGVPAIDTLLDDDKPRRRRRIRYSPSAVVVHGIVETSETRGWPGDHHTVDFGAAWKSTFAEIAPTGGTNGRLMRDPSFLLTRPAITDPDTFSRNGFESVSVLMPCPNLDAAPLAWSGLASAYVAESLAELECRGYVGISRMQVLRVDDPSSWAAAGYGAGTPFHAAHLVRQTGPFRTPNRWPGIDNLILAGAATTPGVGIPPALISGRLAADRVTSTRGVR